MLNYTPVEDNAGKSLTCGSKCLATHLWKTMQVYNSPVEDNAGI